MSEPDKLLGEVIRVRRRDELGLSQEGLAAAASLSRGHVGRIERGATSLSFPTLVRLSAALGLTPADLVRRFDLAAETSSRKKSS